MFNEHIQMGLPSTKEPITSINDMRAAIERGSQDSSLIRNALDMARYQGLSGEDKYVILAYHALLALEAYWKQALNISRLSPIPPMIMKDESPERRSEDSGKP